MTDGLTLAFALLLAGLILAMTRRAALARFLTGAGALVAAVAAIVSVGSGTAITTLPFALAGQTVVLRFTTSSLWLMGFGMVPAALAVWLCSPRRVGRPGWLAGAALSLLGALGVFGLQDGYSFLIAWEVMSLGGGVMLFAEKASEEYGASTFYMLALLEVGAVAILLAFLFLANYGGGMGFTDFTAGAHAMPGGLKAFTGLLLIVGFGAKLGLLPFYEWYPSAYASGSGASGAILSGVVLNAAFFALSRGLVQWLPVDGAWLFALGEALIVIGVISAILTSLYAFQQDDWRRLLSFSSAENASIAASLLGACLVFRENGSPDLAALAWTVTLLHMAGHALAKGCLFLAADGVREGGHSYRIAQRGWMRHAGAAFGIGALFAVMSLAALPPQMGFVSEWFVFQTLFQGFHLSSLIGRLTFALAGAGLALTAAVALATYVKAFGVGLLGARDAGDSTHIRSRYCAGVLLLGLLVLASAVGLPWWLPALHGATMATFDTHPAFALHQDWILIPLSSAFAFISPTKLVIAIPLLAILPLALLLIVQRYPLRRVPVWYGGMAENARRAATTSLTFSNATRTIYNFIYRPTHDTSREQGASEYFIRGLTLHHGVSDMFGPLLFRPTQRFVWRLAGRLRALQSGDINLYLALIGAWLIIILILTLY